MYYHSGKKSIRRYRLRKLITILCIVVTGYVFVVWPTSEERKKAAYENGQAYYEKAEYKSAVLELKNAIQIDPDFADAHFLLGMVKYKQKHFKEAYASFIRLSELDPDHLENNLQLAKIFLQGKKIDPADAKLDAVLKINPHHHEASKLKARILVAQNKNQAAIKILQHLVKQGTRSSDVYTLLAAAFLKEKAMDRAEVTIKAGIKANPNVISLQTFLARFYENSGRGAEAVNTLQETISKHPKDIDPKLMLANILWNMTRGAEAENVLNSILSLQPDNMDNLERVASFYVSKNQFIKAEQKIRERIKKQPEQFRLRFMLSKLLEMQNRAGEAIDTLRACLMLSEEPANPDTILCKNLLAKLHFKTGDVDAAEHYVEQIIAHAPNNIAALSLLADINSVHGKPEEAIAQLETIIEKHPQHIPGYIHLANTYQLYDEQGKAAMTLVKALRRFPGSSQLLFSYAKLLFEMDEFTKAEGILDMLIKSNPSDPSIMVLAGDMYFNKKQFFNAAKLYEKVISKAPNSLIGYIRLADLHRNKGEIKKALGYLLKGYEKKPESDQIFTGLVKYNIILEKYDDALMLCRERLKQFPGNAVTHNQIGAVYQAQGRFDEAVAAYNRSIEIRPQWQTPRNNLIQLYVSGSEGREEEMIQKLRDAYQGKLDKREISLTEALIYEKTGKFDQAKSVYGHMLKDNPSDVTAANNLAYRMIEHPTGDSDLDQAIALARKAVISNPGNREIMDTLGWAYYRKGEFNEAIPLLQISQKAYPEHPIINYHLGMALHAAGRSEEARDRFVKALSIQKDFPGSDLAARLIKEIPPPRKKKVVAQKPINFDQISTEDLQSFGLESLFQEMEANSVSPKDTISDGGAFKLD